MIRRERRNPTLPTKGGPRRVPGCFAKTERELPPPHVLHYNIIVPAESPPPADGAGHEDFGSRNRCQGSSAHARSRCLVTRALVPCRDGHQSFPFTPTGFGRPRPSPPNTQCWLGSWQREDVGGRQPRGPGADAGITELRARWLTPGESHDGYCRQDSAQRSQVKYMATATRLRARSSSGKRALVVTRTQSCEQAVVVRGLGSSWVATPQPLGVGRHGVNRTFQAGDEGPCNRRRPAFHPPEDPGAAPAAACTR